MVSLSCIHAFPMLHMGHQRHPTAFGCYLPERDPDSVEFIVLEKLEDLVHGAVVKAMKRILLRLKTIPIGALCVRHLMDGDL